MMKKGITLIVMLLFVITSGAISIKNPLTQSQTINVDNSAYSHTILGEFGTYQLCPGSRYAHEALIYLYKLGDYPFYYVTHIYDLNKHAYQRVKTELGLTTSPTVFWDGGWRKDVGAPDNKTTVTKYKKSINICGNRTVADIDLTLNVEWLGAVNEYPEDNEIDVSLYKNLSWTNTEMVVNATVDNNENSTYNGHLHVYVCDIKSSMGWYDTADRLYTNAFLDYAFNQNLAIGAGQTWEDSTNWDGKDHDNGTHVYDKITEDNTILIASIFDKTNNDYTDETAGFRFSGGTDPKTFTVYFGEKTPPPLVKSNITTLSYDPGKLDWNTTYFWKVDVWNNKSEKIKGKIWKFTTRDNNPPNIPSNPFPSNGSINDTICPKNFSWSGGDPDGDKVFYDLYFGEYTEPPQPPELLAENLTNSWYQDSHLLEFETRYIWKIVARDEFGYKTGGPKWRFQTQKNLPPDKAKDPNPPDGAHCVPPNANLSWNGSDSNPCDILTYDVYFGVTNPPNLKKSNISINTYNPPGDMDIYKKYYWRINTWDSGGLKSIGDVWSFTVSCDNLPPYDPTITGPRQGKAGERYEFIFNTTDPENHKIYYKIDWDDGNVTDWLGPYKSGTNMSLNHTFEKGTYYISCKAKDEYGMQSNWTKFKHISPKSKNIWFLGWLERFPMLQKILDVLRLNSR